ncbi:MAG: CotH kinase family protein [Cytophagales bacterium]|nr:CotH kinase family protein [Cytophagales bacterium]
MEIATDNNSGGSSIETFWKHVSLKKGLLVILLILSIAAFGFGCMIYGAYLNKTGQTANLKMFLYDVYNLDFSFFAKSIQGATVEIEQLDIDVKFKNWQKIRYFRELALKTGGITVEMQEEIPARVRYNQKTYRVDLSLTGQTNEHTRHPYKWSLEVKVKDGEKIMGMRKFALLFPRARGYLTDWIATKLLQSQNVVGIRNDFVNVNVNGKPQGLYYLEERWDKEILNNNGYPDGIIFKAIDSGIKVYGMKRVMEDQALSGQYNLVRKKWFGFLSGEIEATEIFDLNKFASLFVVSDIMGQKHAIFLSNMRFYFNPSTGLIEPIGREWGYLRKETLSKTSLSIGKPDPDVVYHIQLHEDSILSKIFNSFTFEEQYIRQAEKLADNGYLDSVINLHKQELDLYLKKVYAQNPFYEFPLDLLYENQNFILRKLNPELPSIVAYCEYRKDGLCALSIKNKADLPVEIHSILYNRNICFTPEKRIRLRSNYKALGHLERIQFSVDEGSDHGSFTPDSLEIEYSILGLPGRSKTIVLPGDSDLAENPYSAPYISNLDRFGELTVNEFQKSITFSRDTTTIRSDLVIPEGYFVQASPGTVIDLIDSSGIISYAPFLFFGEEDAMISIISSDASSSGLTILNSDRSSEFNFVNFKHLSVTSDVKGRFQGHISMHNSPVAFNNCVFMENRSVRPAINISRSEFYITNTRFEDISSQAINVEHCDGFIGHVKFEGIDRDIITSRGSKINLERIYISRSGGMILNAQARSHVIGTDLTFDHCKIGFVSKGYSDISVDQITIHASGPKSNSLMTGRNIRDADWLFAYNDEGFDVRIEEGSGLNINGKAISRARDIDYIALHAYN